MNHLLLKKSPNTERDNTKSFFFISMLHHIQQIQFMTSWIHTSWKFYSMWLSHRLGSFQLPLVCINGSHTCWAALLFVRWYKKMIWWILFSKRGRFLLARYSEIAWKIWKMYIKWWSILLLFIILPNLKSFFFICVSNFYTWYSFCGVFKCCIFSNVFNFLLLWSLCRIWRIVFMFMYLGPMLGMFCYFLYIYEVSWIIFQLIHIVNSCESILKLDIAPGFLINILYIDFVHYVMLFTIYYSFRINLHAKTWYLKVLILLIVNTFNASLMINCIQMNHRMSLLFLYL